MERAVWLRRYGGCNLNRRTNNALVQTFNVNNLNQLTTATRSGTLTVAGTVGSPNTTASVTVSGTGLSSGAATMYGDGTWARSGATLADGANSYTATATDTAGRSSVDSVSFTLPATVTFSYDGNGNLTSDGSRTFEYDFENQLTNVYVATKWRSEFIYDTLMRRRARKEYTWLGGAWVQTNEVRYVYDQRLVVQERWYNPQLSLSAPQKLITYTRGNDLSRDLQEADGTGGLLARSDSSLAQSHPVSAHAFYVTDANGNITALVNSKDVVVARYQYDPYGNLISMGGPMAEANLYRFSSKEVHPHSGLVYYLFRYYDPSLQRWLNVDPIGEAGGLNLYQFALNDPLNVIDLYGLACYPPEFVGPLLPGDWRDLNYYNRHPYPGETMWPFAWRYAVNFYASPEGMDSFQRTMNFGSMRGMPPKIRVEPYNRLKHYGRTPTRADRKAFGANSDQVVNHEPELVKRY